MNILYYECFAGISGDMNLGALIDLGVPEEYLKSELQKLPVSGYAITAEKSLKMGISGTKVTVQLNESHHHGHHHGDEHHSHHRSFSDIKKLIEESELSSRVKKDSIGIFTFIAQAEGKIHNKPANEVHFHEVGAIDSIVDIVGATICIDYLNPDKIMCSTVQLGGGFVKCAHGTFPVPAPATMEILQNVPVAKGIVQKETTTPTGAAILKYYVSEFTDTTTFSLSKTSYGIGHYDFDIPNVLRVSLVTEESILELETASATMIECNIDDMPAEHTEFVLQNLFKMGAYDVFYTPIVMKKGRPAIKLSVLCGSDMEEKVKLFLLENTSTIGMRQYLVTKTMLPRTMETLSTPWGDVRIKKCSWNQQFKIKPEIDDCNRIALENNLSLQVVVFKVNVLISKKYYE